MFHVHVLLIFFIILIAIISHHWINAIFFSEGYGIISSFKGRGHAGLHVSRASSLPTSLSTSNRSRVWPFREEVLRRILRFLWPNATREEYVCTLFCETQSGKQ